MRAALWNPAAALVVTAFVVACSTPAKPEPASWFAEEPAGSAKWVTIDAEPAWVTNPPAKDGCLVFVADGQSNLRSIAASGRSPSAERDAAARVRELLVPVVGPDDASRAAAAVPKALRLVRRACKEQGVGRPDVPGAGLCTAWALWQLPVDPVVATLPAEKREWARAALLASR